MQKGPDGNYHSGWVSEMMWENKNSFNFGYSWGNSGGGSGGIVFNLFYGTAKDKDQRYSLKSATDKNGIEGIRISWWEEGSSDAEKLQELVGHSVFLSNSSNTGAQGGGGMTFPSFSTLWGNYPQDVNGSHAHPSVDPYPNQCAIRVSDAFQKSGIDMSSYPKVNKTSDGYARSSKGLADWTWQNFGKPKIMSVETFQKNYSGQTGLIFENANPGYTSHIDLWNAGATGSGFYTVSYKEIWFWPIK
ncbi:MAG: hypothetical protein IPL97_10525 [Niastella sp.]|nr:hypothetical protein [Niastella sp.]